MRTDLGELETLLGYSFDNRALLIRALTHSSLANEANDANGNGKDLGPLDNERLEFLGDSVLGWVVCDWLFRRFEKYDEGRLSLLKNHLVSASHLVAAAQRLRLGEFLQLGRGEETAGGRSKQRLLVNAFEAVLAAVYLDGGVEPARKLVLSNILPDDEELDRLAGAGPPHDYRAELDRLTRDRALPKPEYLVVSEGGPGHARVFTVEVKIGKQHQATAEGPSKKLAAHRAAKEVCRRLQGDDTAPSL